MCVVERAEEVLDGGFKFVLLELCQIVGSSSITTMLKIGQKFSMLCTSPFPWCESEFESAYFNKGNSIAL